MLLELSETHSSEIWKGIKDVNFEVSYPLDNEPDLYHVSFVEIYVFQVN